MSRGRAAGTRGASSAGFACTIFISCTFLQTRPASPAAQASFYGGESAWHGDCNEWLDPPFGGLWCDQPALFLSGVHACAKGGILPLCASAGHSHIRSRTPRERPGGVLRQSLSDASRLRSLRGLKRRDSPGSTWAAPDGEASDQRHESVEVYGLRHV